MSGLSPTVLYPSIDPNDSIWDEDRASVLADVERWHGPVTDDRFREAYAFVLPRVDSGLGLQCGRRKSDLVSHVADRLGVRK